MENIQSYHDIFDAKTASKQSKLYKNECSNEILLKIYNESIIPAIKKGYFSCAYDSKNSIPKTVIEKLSNKGFIVSNYNNVRLTIQWLEENDD